MAIKRKKVTSSVERQILIGMIVSDQFLREVIPLYSPDLFEIPYAPIIAKWCESHYTKYEKAPNRAIQETFDAWKRTKPDEEQEVFIEEFLASLSDEFEHGMKFNADYALDVAIKHFKLRSFKLLAEDLNFMVGKEDLEEAEAIFNEFQKIEKVHIGGIDPFDDENSIRAAFAKDEEGTLFKVPGALGRLWNEELKRDSLIGLMGPEKRGKTWWLMFLGMMAHYCRCNVAFFSVGDMSEDQMVRRQHIYISKKSDKPKYCGEMLIPTLDCKKNQDDSCNLKQRVCDFGVLEEDGSLTPFHEAKGYKPCTACQRDFKGDFRGAVWYTRREAVEPLSWKEALTAGKAYKKKVRAKGYRLSTHSNSSINVTGIRNILDTWERTEGFVPDVILIDYADILAPEPGSKEFRHQQNDIWKALRRLSQDKHACVITATQANAASYGQESVKRENFSEDKRKFAHATAMYALNQTPDEKRKGVMRIAPLVVREDDYDEEYNVHVLQCLQIGRPYLASY